MEKVKVAELKAGEKIAFGRINGEPLIWRIAEQNHRGFPADTVAVVTDRTIGNITFAPASPSDKIRERRLYGNNRYKDSYIRRYINSDGFLKEVFDSEELGSIVETELKVRQPDADGGGIDTVRDRLFLLSASEAGLDDDGAEGEIIELFKDDKNRCALDINGDPDWWWLRSPYVSNSYLVRPVLTDRSSANLNACYGSIGVRPACNLLSSNLVSVV
jgi:hypothetical protein